MTEQETWALDAEIRELEEELPALGVNPDELPPADGRPGLSLDEHVAELEKEIAAMEKELDDDNNH